MDVSEAGVERSAGVGRSRWMVIDELWNRLESLLPQCEQCFRLPGRKSLPGRETLCGNRLPL